MSGPLRLQVQAGGAFLSRANVLRVMGPAQGAQLRIPAPARLRHEALALGSAGLEARAARTPGGRRGPAGSRGSSCRSPGARLWSPGVRAPPAARPNSRPGRGGAGLSAPAGRVLRPERVGPRGRPAPELLAAAGSATGVGAWGTGSAPSHLGLGEGVKGAGG